MANSALAIALTSRTADMSSNEQFMADGPRREWHRFYMSFASVRALTLGFLFGIVAVRSSVDGSFPLRLDFAFLTQV